MSALRREVLQSFKSLHRARKLIFEGDSAALEMGRQQINDGYKKNKHVAENHAISELIQYSKEVEKELRTSVIQAKEVTPGMFEAKITNETLMLDNVPYNDCSNVKTKEIKKKN